MTVMGKNNAMGKCQAKKRNWIPTRLLVLGAVAVMCCAWNVPAQAEIKINGNAESIYGGSFGSAYPLPITQGVVVVVTGDNDNINLLPNSAYKPWRGILSIRGGAIPTDPDEYTAQLTTSGNFFMAGIINVNSSSLLNIKSGTSASASRFILARGGQMYLAGGLIENGGTPDPLAPVYANGQIAISTNFISEHGSSQVFRFSNLIPAASWDQVANITIDGNATFNGNIGVVSQNTANWQTRNGIEYKAARITVNGKMETGAIDVAPSSLFYRSSLLIDNAQGYAGATESNIYISAKLTGFGGLNDNLRGVANMGYRVTYLSENQMAVARNLDRARMAVVAGSPIAQVIQPMWNYGDAASFNGSRELGADEQIARINLLGNLMEQLSGDTHANAMYLGLYRPWTAPLSHVNLGAQMVFTGNPTKPLGNMNRVWITPTYTGTELKDDGNARSGGITRTGAQIGVDRRIAQNASAGIALGYHSAYLYQEDDRVQFCDLQLGAYGGAMVGNYFEVRSYLGLGLQTYDSTRIVNLAILGAGDDSQSAFGKADGCGIYFTTEFSRPVFCGPIIVRPTLAIDSETAIRKEFTETGDEVALRVGRTSFSRNRFRIGGSFETNPQPTSRVVLTSRIFYGVQLDGQDYARVDSQFDSVQADPGQTIRSIASGFNYLDVGGGIKSHINKARTLTGILNYDGSFSEYSNTNTVALGLMYIF